MSFPAEQQQSQPQLPQEQAKESHDSSEQQPEQQSTQTKKQQPEQQSTQTEKQQPEQKLEQKLKQQPEQQPISEKQIYKPKEDTSSVPFTFLKQFVQATTSRPSSCLECASATENNCHLLDIPGFKDMVITIDKCVTCGHTLNFIKTGDSISERGRKTTLFIKEKHDLSRELVKSISCIVSIVELGMELTPGTLGIQFCTIGDFLKLIQIDIVKHIYSIATKEGDDQSNLAPFLVQLDLIVKGEKGFTLLLDDPLNNSYIQPFDNDNEGRIVIEEYERTPEITANALSY